jgi:flagellar basal body-associated protein FliL
MYPAQEASSWEWPEVILILGVLVVAFIFIGGAAATWLEYRKTKIAAQQDEDLRQLVRRYEQLAENTLDAQKRVAADVSELRSRATAIEQILRTVE